MCSRDNHTGEIKYHTPVQTMYTASKYNPRINPFYARMERTYSQ